MIKRLGVLFLMMAVYLPVEAQQMPALRVGYTDHEAIIANMPEYLEVQRELQSAFQDKQEELQGMEADFQEKLQRYQTQQQLLSEERRAEREAELQNTAQALQEEAQQAEQQLASLEAELLGPIFERVDAAIQQIAEEKGLDLVLRTQAGPAQPIILFANTDRITDITLEVARELGIDVDEE